MLNEISIFYFILLYSIRLETTSACFNHWKTRHTTRVLKTRHLFGNRGWQIWMSTCTTWTRSRESGSTWSPFLAGVPYQKNRGASSEWTMISGEHFYSHDFKVLTVYEIKCVYRFYNCPTAIAWYIWRKTFISLIEIPF